ncbi:MAG: uroporphyrinogen-III C-methyltransferase [Sulfuricaulis sp.]
MTDTDAKKTDADAPSSPRRKESLSKNPPNDSRRGKVRGGLALIVASLALITSGYIWYTVLYRNAKLFSMDVVGTLDRVESDYNKTQVTLTSNENDVKTLKDTQDTLRASLEKINTDLERNRQEWALTETEQLLVIANNRLQLARDPHSALAALRAADQQLRALASPKLLPVRRELAREITLLEPLDKTDITGITLRLATMADTVDSLPLAVDIQMHQYAKEKAPGTANGTPVAAADNGWRQMTWSLWQDIRSLVRIRNDVSSQRSLLPPEQQYFLRENLRLMLFGAEQALLQGSVPTYQQNLKTAVHLLKDYFDVNSPVVSAVQNELSELQTTKLATELPDISDSLAMLRRISGEKAEP